MWGLGGVDVRVGRECEAWEGRIRSWRWECQWETLRCDTGVVLMIRG